MYNKFYSKKITLNKVINKIKNVILFILICAVSIFGYSQQNIDNFNTQFADYYIDGIVIDNDKTVMLNFKRYQYAEGNHFFGLINELQALSNSYNEIILQDLNFNLIKKLTIESTPDSIVFFITAEMDEANENLRFLGNYISTTDTNKILLLTDFNLNPIDTLILYDTTPSNTYFDMSIGKSFYNNSGNLIVESFDLIEEFDTLGNLINYQTPWTSNRTVFQSIQSKYIVLFGSTIYTYDSLFNVLPETVGMEFEYGSLLSNTGKSIKQLDKDYHYILGIFGFLNENEENRFGECLIKLFEDKSYDFVYLDTLSHLQSYAQGFNSFDLYSESHIYFGGTDKYCGFMDYVTNPNLEECQNQILTLSCVDSVGNLNWQKYIDFENSLNFAVDIIATPDSGCFYIYYRYNEEENLFNEHDTYYIKFDKHGNVVNTTTSTGDEVNNIPIYNILAYPNPTTDKLHFKGIALQTDKTIVSLYNMQGQLQISESIANKSIDVSCLPNGIYECVISNEKGIMQSQQIVKQ